jgi:hypothetical protein
MSTRVGDELKVRAEHQARAAFVYVRQSSMHQVRTNLESQRRQYEWGAALSGRRFSALDDAERGLAEGAS